jgi:hypothetical protein
VQSGSYVTFVEGWKLLENDKVYGCSSSGCLAFQIRKLTGVNLIETNMLLARYVSRTELVSTQTERCTHTRTLAASVTPN